jgi:hypothetical protein
MKLSLLLYPAFFVLSFFTACVSTSPNSEFVKSVSFSALDVFSFKHTLVTGMDFRESDEMLLEDLSAQCIVSELQARGFDLAEPDAEGDFFVVVKWKKAVTSYANPFDHIDPYNEVISRRDSAVAMFAPRLHLTVEIYESRTGNLFWRKQLPNIFDANQFTEERVVAALQQAVKNFPSHIEKDPNLPSIE